MNRCVPVLAVVCLIVVAPAGAQVRERPFEVGAQVVGASSGEFDTTDVGIGARLAWNLSSLVGAEAEMSFFPEDLSSDRGPTFSRSRIEGLFGATVGPVIGRIRPFAKVRPGFVMFRGAPRPFACVLIFPPPLACSIATGDTVFALDFGGGVEVFPSGWTFIRFDLSDRLMRYHGPVIDADREVRNDAFFGHDLRFAAGGGFRF
jgi:hypothetical protein